MIIQHIKTHLFLILVILAFNKTVYAQEEQFKKGANRLSTYNKLEKVKFGFACQAGLTDPYFNVGGGYEIFGEYKFYKELGVRLSILYNKKSCRIESLILSGYKDLSTRANTKSIDMPITIRFYPISNWNEYCFFAGLQLGYVIDSEFKVTQRAEFLQDFGCWNYKDVHLSLAEAREKVQVRRFQLGMIGGFNYEFGFGLGLGGSFYGGLIGIVKAERVVDSLLLVNLSYNFARLVDYICRITS
jgi:hypothetical protein